jgi:hypothetical protein
MEFFSGKDVGNSQNLRGAVEFDGSAAVEHCNERRKRVLLTQSRRFFGFPG